RLKISRHSLEKVWPICGQNSQHFTGSKWKRMGTDVKTLEIPWWLQLSKRQILTLLPRLSFGTVRSVVRIHSPRPLTSTTYGCPTLAAVILLWPICGYFFQPNN